MRADQPFFSVIIPVYNRAELVSPAIESVVGQTYSNWELIVVDDGSTDNVEAVIRSFKNHPISYIKTENRERGAARNTGVGIAKGEYVCFLDSDDYWLPDHLFEASRLIDNNPSVMVFHLNFEFRDENGRLIRSQILPSRLNDSLKKNNVISCNGVFLKKSVALENPFSEARELSGSEDYELWLRLAVKYPILHMNDSTSVIVLHKGRSMAEKNFPRTEGRIQKFLELALNNNEVVNFLGKNINQFKAGRYGYLSLHAALAGEKKSAVKYWGLAVLTRPLFMMSFRSLMILKSIFIQSRPASI